MAVYTERNNTTLLSAAADADGDVLTVTKVNGQAALVGVPVPLSVGGSVTVASDGVVTFDDTGFVVPEVGEHVADSLIATISDGTTETDTSVNLELYGALEGTPTVFGALTRAFEGGVAAPAGATSITAGDPDGHFVISDGMILPTLAGSGALSGSYVLTMNTGAMTNILILPDTFSVTGDSELSGLLNDASQPFDGKVILLRPGQFGTHLVPPQTLTEGFTLRGETGAIIDQLRIRALTGDPTVAVRDLTFRPAAVETAPTIRLFVDDNDTPNGTLIIENCRLKGHPGIIPNSDLWSAKIDYTGANGSFQVGETLTGTNNGAISLPILNVIDNGDGSGTLWVSDNPGKGDGGSVKGNRVADGVVLSGDTSGAQATASGAIYGGDPGLGIGMLMLGPAFRNVYVRNNVFWGHGEALRTSAKNVLEVTDNVCDECRDDFLKVVLDGNNRPSERLHIKRNIHMRPFGRAEDFGNPHVDGVQFLFGNMTMDLTGLEITDNIFMLGGRATTVAPLFLTQGSGGGAIEGGIIENNIFANGEGVPLRADRWRGGSISNNVATYLSGGTHPTILFLVGERLADANTVYTGNIVEQIAYYTADAKVGGFSFDPAGNYTPGPNPDWSLAYDNLAGAIPGDLSDLLTQLTPKAASPIMAGSTWVDGSDMGCVDHAGRFIARDGTDITDQMLALEARAFGADTGALVQVAAISVDDFAVDAWPYDVRSVFGENTARIPVSGTITPPLADISIRARQAGTAGPGQIVATTAPDGTFSGQMDALEDGQNHQLEVFVDGQPAIAATTTNTYSTGNHIVMWTQSEFHNPFHQASTLPAPPLSDPANMIFVSIDGTADTVTTAPDPVVVSLADSGATVAMKYMANLYAQAAPGRKFVVIDCMEPGTSMFDLQDDDDLTARHWSSAARIFGFIRDEIGDTPSFNFFCWYAADRGRYRGFSGIETYRDTAAPYFFLETGDGTPMALGDAHPFAADSAIEDVEHPFYDNAAPQGQRGTGLYATGEAKFMFAVNGFLNAPPTNPLVHFDDQSNFVIRELSDNLDWWLANDARAQARGFERGYEMYGFRLGNDFGSGWSDASHPTINDETGSPLALKMVALNHLKAMGVVQMPEPRITDAVWGATEVTVSLDIGAGNQLTTWRNELSLGPVDAEPWRGAVSNFQFERAGVYDFPAASDIAITDNGAATGTATITITRANQNGDILSYGSGGGTGCINTDDMLDGYHLNIPSVKPAGVDNVLVPVARNPKGAFMVAGSVAPSGPQFVTLNDTSYEDTAALATSDDKLTLDFSINVPDQAGFLSISQNNFQIDIIPNGRVRLIVIQPSPYAFLVNITTPNGSLPEDTDTEVRVTIDHASGACAILIDGVVQASGTMSTTGGSFIAQPIHLMSNRGTGSFVQGTFAHARVYKDALVDHSLPGTLYKEVTGPATSANAPNGWTRTGGAVSD